MCRSIVDGLARDWSGVSRDGRTGREALLELVGLLVVLENKSVEVLLAPDLELDVLGLLALLDPRGYRMLEHVPFRVSHLRSIIVRAIRRCQGNVGVCRAIRTGRDRKSTRLNSSHS